MKIYSVRQFASERGREYNHVRKMFLCGPIRGGISCQSYSVGTHYLIQKLQWSETCRVILYRLIGLCGNIAVHSQFARWSPTPIASLSVYLITGGSPVWELWELPQELLPRLACEGGWLSGSCWKWLHRQFPVAEVSASCFCEGLVMWQLTDRR